MPRFNTQQSGFIRALDDGDKSLVEDRLNRLLLWGMNNVPAFKEPCRLALLGRFGYIQCQRLGWSLLRIQP